jgi:membrane-associated phospholipid phosphatase
MNGEIIQILPAETIPFLAAVYRWGISVIRTIQVLESPGLTGVIKFITALGSGAFIAPLLLFIFWCVDEKRGFRMAVTVIFSAWANTCLKNLFKQPRPFGLEPSAGLAEESGYGFPSGHAQTSLVFTLPLSSWAASVKKHYSLLIRAGAVFFILLLGFTRLYLGVHFPTDVAGGWLSGGIILTAFYFLGPRIRAWLAAAGKRSQLICTAAAAFVMNSLRTGDARFPALFLGFGCGYSLMINSFPFSARKPVNGKAPGFPVYAARYAIGIAGAAAVYLGLGLVFPGGASLLAGIPGWGEDTVFYELGRFIRCGLTGLWISAGAPRVFLRLGIAGRGDVSAGRGDSADGTGGGAAGG